MEDNIKTKEQSIEELQRQAEASLEEWAVWCLASDPQGRCFPGWAKDLMRAYLAFHVRQRTVCFVREATSVAATFGEGVQTCAPMAMGVCWQVREEFARRPEFARKPYLYHHTDRSGDCLFIDNLIATDRRGMGVLMSELQFRWPDWRRLKLFGKRRGKLVEYNPERIFARVEGIAL